MATIDDRRSETANTTPESTGVRTTTPQSVFSSEYSFLLQMVMELQKSTGQLTEATNSLKTVVERQNARFDKIEEKLSGVTHKIYAAGVVLFILLAVSSFIVNKAWDLMVQQLHSKTEITSPVQSIQIPPSKSPTKKP